MILFLTQDLMIQAKASASAKKLQLTIRAVSNIGQLIEALKNNNVKAVFLDLQHPGFSISDFQKSITNLDKRPTTIAFAQHVEEKLLFAARQAEIDNVLTRGQFASRLPALLQQLKDSVGS